VTAAAAINGTLGVLTLPTGINFTTESLLLKTAADSLGARPDFIQGGGGANVSWTHPLPGTPLGYLSLEGFRDISINMDTGSGWLDVSKYADVGSISGSGYYPSSTINLLAQRNVVINQNLRSHATGAILLGAAANRWQKQTANGSYNVNALGTLSLPANVQIVAGNGNAGWFNTGELLMASGVDSGGGRSTFTGTIGYANSSVKDLGTVTVAGFGGDMALNMAAGETALYAAKAVRLDNPGGDLTLNADIRLRASNGVGSNAALGVWAAEVFQRTQRWLLAAKIRLDGGERVYQRLGRW